jgi:hypothetical protein
MTDFLAEPRKPTDAELLMARQNGNLLQIIDALDYDPATERLYIEKDEARRMGLVYDATKEKVIFIGRGMRDPAIFRKNPPKDTP